MVDTLSTNFNRTQSYCECDYLIRDWTLLVTTVFKSMYFRNNTMNFELCSIYFIWFVIKVVRMIFNSVYVHCKHSNLYFGIFGISFLGHSVFKVYICDRTTLWSKADLSSWQISFPSQVRIPGKQSCNHLLSWKIVSNTLWKNYYEVCIYIYIYIFEDKKTIFFAGFLDMDVAQCVLIDTGWTKV